MTSSLVSPFETPGIVFTVLGAMTTVGGIAMINRRYYMVNPINRDGRNLTAMGLVIVSGGIMFFAADNQMSSKYTDKRRNALKTSGIAVLGLASGIGGIGVWNSDPRILVASLATVGVGSVMIGFADDAAGGNWVNE